MGVAPPPLVVVSTRAARVESEHLVSVAVVDDAGRLVARAGDPARATYWRSAAKPFQALACVRAGAADAFGFGDDALALACASHSSEPAHVALARHMLDACGCSERDLACGGHVPISAAIHEQLVRARATATPIMSNCSGKHAAMLALARHLGTDVRGYERASHPVQQRILDEIVAATGAARDDIGFAGDGCRAVTFFLPLTSMATAWARLGASEDAALRRVRRAMTSHPQLVAGTGRSCTDLMRAAGARLLAKVGAEGVYCAALPEAGLGVALKVHNGDGRAATVALCAVLRALDDRLPAPLPHDAWTEHAAPVVRDTRGDAVGALSVAGDVLAFV